MCRPPPRPGQTEGAVVENVISYKNLGLWLDNKLSWDNTDHLSREAQSRLYFLRRLRSFNVCRKLLKDS